MLNSLTEVKKIAEFGWSGFAHHLLGLGPEAWQFLGAPVGVLVALRSLTDRIRVVFLRLNRVPVQHELMSFFERLLRVDNL